MCKKPFVVLSVMLICLCLLSACTDNKAEGGNTPVVDNIVETETDEKVTVGNEEIVEENEFNESEDVFEDEETTISTEIEETVPEESSDSVALRPTEAPTSEPNSNRENAEQETVTAPTVTEGGGKGEHETGEDEF